MWTAKNRGRYDRSKLRYPSDLTDNEWAHVEPLIPSAKRGGQEAPYSRRHAGFAAARHHSSCRYPRSRWRHPASCYPFRDVPFLENALCRWWLPGGRTFKRPWRRSCHSSKLKSSSAPIGRKDSWCFHAVGSSNAPLLGSTAADGS